MSMPVSGPPSRLPLSALIVPMSAGLLAALAVNALPPWQPAQPLAWKTCLASRGRRGQRAVGVPSGLGCEAFSEAT